MIVRSEANLLNILFSVKNFKKLISGSIIDLQTKINPNILYFLTQIYF